ncbi:MAG: hypothetical protein ACJ789_01950 [Thermomicrobiales bacterium]
MQQAGAAANATPLLPGQDLAKIPFPERVETLNVVTSAQLRPGSDGRGFSWLRTTPHFHSASSPSSSVTTRCAIRHG